ncbi:SoxR reducing system RseC family protein [Isoalcanivorax indicus]|uniref:SoxR reducing system RseC family protein n=1 Tax=Isoalcanivorax indicus TaxID=2202653 RepID=UPI000DBAB2DC|nr:SoxR reducing system RseC family protein [Isoalcanivorax indicus]
MIEESGRVVAVEPGAVWVETLRFSACRDCSARKGCGHGLMDSERAGARARVRALNPTLTLAVDDAVVVGIPEGALLRGAVMLYLVPLLLMFVAALVGAALPSGLPGGDLAAPFGVAGLAIGFLVNRWYSQQHARDPALHPQVVRRAGAPAAAAQPVSLCHH